MLALLLSVTDPCLPTHARYVLRDDPSTTARFFAVPRTRDWPAGVALNVRFGRTGRSYWFLPWQGGTDGRTNVAWVREAATPVAGQPVRRDIQMFTTDATYHVGDDVPDARRPAPAHIFLPDLRQVTWYLSPDGARDGGPRQMFDQIACSPPTGSEPPPRIEFPPIP